jgi:cytochrome c-type biogenesis protein CcmH
MTMRKIVFSCLLVVLALGAASRHALAQGPLPPQPTPGVTDDQVNAIARELYCPVCENVPLDVCPTDACEGWRDLIREQLGEGMNDTEIKSYFVTRFGDRVLPAPPARGFNWLAYLIPPLAILAGAVILWRAMLSWRRPAASPTLNTSRPEPISPPPPDASTASDEDPYIKRLEDELRNM